MKNSKDSKHYYFSVAYHPMQLDSEKVDSALKTLNKTPGVVLARAVQATDQRADTHIMQVLVAESGVASVQKLLNPLFGCEVRYVEYAEDAPLLVLDDCLSVSHDEVSAQTKERAIDSRYFDTEGGQ